MTVGMLESLQENGILLDLTEKNLRDDYKNLQHIMSRCEMDPYYTTIRLQRDTDMHYQFRHWYNNWACSKFFDRSFTQTSPLACGIASDNLTYKYTHVLWLREMIQDTGPKSSYQAEWQAMDRISRNTGEYACRNRFTSVSRDHVYIVSRIVHPILFYDSFSQKPIVNWDPPLTNVPTVSCPRCEKKMAVKICHLNAECMFCQVYYKKEGGKWVVILLLCSIASQLIQVPILRKDLLFFSNFALDFQRHCQYNCIHNLHILKNFSENQKSNSIIATERVGSSSSPDSVLCLATDTYSLLVNMTHTHTTFRARARPGHESLT